MAGATAGAAVDAGGNGSVAGTVVATAVVGAVGSLVTAPFEHPAMRTHEAITVRSRPIVMEPATGDLPLSVMKRFAILVVGVTLLAASCNASDPGVSSQTLPPLGTPNNTIPPTTVTTVAATDASAVAVAVTPSTIALPAGPCVFTPPAPTGEVTFEIGTRLYTIVPASGASSCLSELTLDNVGPLRWSPAGDRVLLNSITVFDGTQVLPSGYFASNTRVRWSYPTGKALIAPAVADNHLLWRTAGQPETRTDISFLARTDVAAYHPAGRDIFAAGQAADGTAGLFIASNRGENPRLIAQLDQPATTINEIAPDASGSRVYFIHDHHNGTFHVHSLDLPALTLADVTQATEPIADLSVGTTPGAPIGWRIGACTGATRTQVSTAPGSIVDQPAAFAALSTEPVGWLDAQQMVLSVRATGCEGPSDLWLWNIATAAATPLVTGVMSAAVRSVLVSYGEVPGDINSAAPG